MWLVEHDGEQYSMTIMPKAFILYKKMASEIINELNILS